MSIEVRLSEYDRELLRTVIAQTKPTPNRYKSKESTIVELSPRDRERLEEIADSAARGHDYYGLGGVGSQER